MKSPSKLVSAVLILFGLSLFVWLLYDATTVVDTLSLGGVASEAVVALVGLAVVAAAIAFGVSSWRRLSARGNGG